MPGLAMSYRGSPDRPLTATAGASFLPGVGGRGTPGGAGVAWGGHVATLVISPKSIAGARSSIAENHYSLLRTIEDGFGVAHLGAAGWSSSVSMREYFR